MTGCTFALNVCTGKVAAMRDMSTAPKDGTRVLLKVHTRGFSRHHMQYINTGEKWEECWFHEGRWEVWCGNTSTRCTSLPIPIGWMPSPDNGFTMVPVELTDNVAEAIAAEAGCCGGIALDIWDAAIKVARHET